MWANPDWRGGLYAPHAGRDGWLSDYAEVFNAVEGNTTFYSGTPRPDTVDAWSRQAPAGFRFCFKLPQRLTHGKRLRQVGQEVEAFLEALAPLRDRLGPVMIQLPRDFGPDEIPALAQTLEDWPSDYPCAVELRHSEFFHKGTAERDINALLISHGVDRVMLDVRPLFSGPPMDHPGLIQARREKPRRPLHVLSTANFPVIRYIGHLDKDVNEHYFAPWVRQLCLWIKQGKTPFLFVHTADNRQAPELARVLYARIAREMGWPELCAFPGDRQNLLL
ncbi:DUF72 domain-containing protein [Halomonas sp. DP8Y7-1]|uniref:DUF72 domain-containing protein n=1 Tax=Halomonas sp. DP8Y7-1 TaxID=2859078 RepID=UPI001C98D086|nr:DUF72 domain-containing protein [Halomonas sp. DP8Y7-1]MBY6031173.1 DUF72 domain-containing protein [Halomonas sp. DP8Y7-1]